jgi:hypothetical protein
MQFLALGLYVTAVAVMVVTVCRMLFIALRSGLPALDDAFPARSFLWPVAVSSAVFIVTSSGLLDPGVWRQSIALATPFGVAAAVVALRSSRTPTGSVPWSWAGVPIVVVGPALMAFAAP